MEGFGCIVLDNCEVNYEVLNAFTAEFNIKSPSTMTTYEGSNISEVSAGQFKLAVGNFIELNYGNKESKFYIRSIEYINKSRFVIYSTKPTKSKHFIMPILGHNRDFWHYNTWLYNCYLGVDTNDIVLTYRFGRNPKYLEFEKTVRNVPGYFMTSDPDYDLVNFHFRIPDKFRKSVLYFMEGKYSLMSKELKNTIIKFHNYKEFGKTWQILYKDSKLREQMETDFGVPIHADLELYDIPDINEEKLTLC